MANKAQDWVLDDRYTAEKPSDAGVLICWRAEPVARLDLLRPAQLRLGRNGWTVTDDQELRSWGIQLSSVVAGAGTAKAHAKAGAAKRGGQGWRLDVEVKSAIEQRAMTVAKNWCRRNGWTRVTDVSAQAMTRGQQYSLVVVRDIVIAATDPPAASGGNVSAYDPWNPRRSELTETRFTWRPGPRPTTMSDGFPTVRTGGRTTTGDVRAMDDDLKA